MCVAEIYKDKKGIERILLFFTDKFLSKEIKNIPTALYYDNHDQWQLLKNDTNIKKLKELNFDIFKREFFDAFKPKTQELIIYNNYMFLPYIGKITQYAIIRHFTKYDTKNCISNKKFDFSKAQKMEFFVYKNNKNLYIPIGLKKELLELVNPFQIVDYRKLKKYKFTDNEIKNCLSYLTLYPEQVQAVKACLNNGNGIVKASTGFGKTEVMIALCKLTSLKTIVLVTSVDLAQQTYTRMKQAKLDVGIVQGTNMKMKHQIIIATVQSSHKVKDTFDMVIVDECHQISELHNKILKDVNILYRFGFSATPIISGKKNELKNLIIKQFIGDIIFEVESKTLQNDHKIAKPFINMIKIKNEELYKLKDNKNWRIIEKLFITDNYERNMKVINLCKEIKTQKMILVKKINHGKIIEKLLLENEINCIFLNGNDSKEQREKILQDFDKNHNDFVLIGSKILFTGINLQNIFNLFYLAGGRSNVEVLQSLGRALRSKTKTTVNVYDFYDCGNVVIDTHSKCRIKYYQDEGFDNIKYIN